VSTAPCRSRLFASDWQGLFVWAPGDVTDRVAVFFDYQNLYRSARECFSPPGAPHREGQVDPLALARLIASRSPFPRRLDQVRIYRGLPHAWRDPKGYGAASRQCRRWAQGGAVVTTRPLRYPANWPNSPPEEKGIDVVLALDFVLGAMTGDFEVGILMSLDTDLRPALERVVQQAAARAEVAAWSAPSGHSRRLALPGRRLWCHWLDQADYRVVADPTDYTRP